MKQSDVEKSIHADAVSAFRDHKLVYSDPIGGRWFIQRPGRAEFSTEVICLRGGRLFVGGDIDDCVFAYFAPSSLTKSQGIPRELVARVAWIANSHLDYVTQKAVIGFGGDSGSFYTWNNEVAGEDLRGQLKTLKEDEASSSVTEIVSDVLEAGYFDEETVMTALGPWNSSLELPRNFGKHVSSRVIYAQAATQKLLELLTQE